MKRRTNPCPSRPSRPRSVLEDYFPGIDRLSDLDAFQTLYQMTVLCPDSERELSLRFLSAFVDSRGLELRPSSKRFRNSEVVELWKGAECLASFSSGPQ